MKKPNTIYRPLSTTARQLGLPVPYIRRLAEAGDIPKLIVNGRLRLNPKAVQQALDEIAATGGQVNAG